MSLDERGYLFFAAYGTMVPRVNAAPSAVYLKGMETDRGQALEGGQSYRLRVPANVPASQFWAVDAYDAETSGFMREAKVVGLDSFSKGLKSNEDGSVDLYFAPRPPPGQESNWISTQPGRRFFLLFRLYGPQQAILDRSWLLNDIVRID
ncbi:hypothetical protein D3C76_938880 [compost metagenome]